MDVGKFSGQIREWGLVVERLAEGLCEAWSTVEGVGRVGVGKVGVF